MGTFVTDRVSFTIYDKNNNMDKKILTIHRTLMTLSIKRKAFPEIELIIVVVKKTGSAGSVLIGTC